MRRSASGLRISGAESEQLLDGDELERLREWLDAEGLYVFTINGFPHGAFHGQRVKADVHAPDWRSAERVAYTLRLAEILARLLPDGQVGTISTSPLSYGRWVADDDAGLALATANVRHVVTALRERRDERGAHVMLTIEPEADGALADIAELVAWWPDDLDREHAGACFDACHASVAFETPDDALAALADAGIAVGKVQLSAALRVPLGDASPPPRGRRAARALRRPDLPASARAARPRRIRRRLSRSARGPGRRRRAGGRGAARALPRADLPRGLRRPRTRRRTTCAARSSSRATARSPRSSRSRRTPGTSCRPISRPPRWTRSRASTRGCSMSSADVTASRRAAVGVSPWLRLARISNTPTVVTDVVAGAMLADVSARASTIALVAVAAALFYTAGMIANDVFDLEVDRRERPERPLPSGLVSVRAAIAATIALFAIGEGLLLAVDSGAGLAGLGLIAAIVLYDAWHKGNALSPLLMGACRALVVRRRGARRLRHGVELGRGSRGAAARLRRRADAGRQGRRRLGRDVVADRGRARTGCLLDHAARGRAPSSRCSSAFVAFACYALWLGVRAARHRAVGRRPDRDDRAARRGGRRCRRRAGRRGRGVRRGVRRDARAADEDRGHMSFDKTVVLCTVALTPDLVGDATPRLKAFADAGTMVPVGGVTPAVTATVQSTYLTGRLPRDHGAVGNGWLFRDTMEVRLWQQSNRLVQAPKVWEAVPGIRAANLSWWFAMYSSAEVTVTPRPMYPADGRKIPDCYTKPGDLRDVLQAQLGQVPVVQVLGPGGVDRVDALARRGGQARRGAPRPGPDARLPAAPRLRPAEEGPRGRRRARGARRARCASPATSSTSTRSAARASSCCRSTGSCRSRAPCTPTACCARPA